MRILSLLPRILALSVLIGGVALPVGASPTRQADPPPASAPQVVGVIDETKPVIVELTGSGAVDLRYRAPDAITINVQVRSLESGTGLDTTLTVLDAGGVQLAFNDDHGSTRADLTPFDSLITGLELPERGDYTIRINSFSGFGSGRAEVTLTLGDTSPAPRIGGNQAETVTGVVPNNDRYTYGVELAAGDVVTITVRATDNTLDPKVALIDPNGIAVATNDDHGSQDSSLSRYDSRIAGYSVQANGFYVIEVTGFGGIGGTFELTINFGGDSIPGSNPNLSGVETIEGTVIPGVPFQHYIDANAGDVITITAHAESENLDVDLVLYTLDEEFLESNYEHGTSDGNLFFYDARINNYIVQRSGTYLIEVTGYEVQSGTRIQGDLELTVQRVRSNAPLGAGDDTIFLGEIQPNGIFSQRFEAQAGDYVTIAIRSLTRGFDPVVDLLAPNGVLLATNDDHGGSEATMGRYDSQIVRYYIEESGTYTIEVSGYRDTAGSFGITVTTIR